ncbi:putative cytochrome c oxidase copper chaperone, cysteine alpha-hairpin motif superfamily [Medicago truncatula]|uniref:Cytochrome C oxidase copper chaperone n=1 Tax=Medicago truncatula TaxID=3880 RepID=G7I329_MEDTR|nr:cytochrome c oxidase copper chaperone 1 [Medicago truncatula]AES61987.2 cytochrome C oxidase copper chaperone [Medicago truncatula]AFK44658.1 unknown [Medicago truncatula]RHN81346.1 putative cytochrome c oxidase copper chaperone, cysteine alpha-hairpin motif superfamily [Medicago truncatula]
MGNAQVQNGVTAPSSSASNQPTAPAASATPAAPATAATAATSATACEVSNAPKKKKICCACPDTKRLRDECIVEHGEDACAKWIEAHRICLRAEGFNV